MKHELKKLEQSQVELSITVTPGEYEKHLKSAATRISDRVAIKGFRPGKAPYDMVKLEVGEMKILQEALEKIVQESFYQTIQKEKLDTIGMPEITIEKSAPGNDVVYKAKVALLPKVKLADLSTIKVKRTAKPITDKEVDEVLENLTKMQAKEVLKKEKSTKEDKVTIDMDLHLNGVPVEGGQAKDYHVYLSENQHIPGFNDALVGVEEGEEKEFDLPFPKDYYNKMLAGNTGTFKVKVKGVYQRQFPEVTDEFAKTLGQESTAKLRELLQHNLSHEEEHKAEERAEIEIFDTLIEKSGFDEIPEVLINAERQKMFYELKHDLDRNGVSIEQYLQDIKKTEKEIFEGFKEQATKRAKAALISRQVAKEHELSISDDELNKEIEMMKKVYKDNKEYMDNINRPEVHDSIRSMLLNKKVLAFLKGKVMEGESHVHEHEHDEK
ncbi:MAG: trigger factor [Candidatus Magasanikbacteria bacterium]